MALVLNYNGTDFVQTPKMSKSVTPAHGLAIPDAYRVTWRITGEIYVEGQMTPTNIAGYRRTLEIALRTSGNLVLVDTANSNFVIDQLPAAPSIYGIVVDELTFPEGDGTEYATHLPFNLVVHADYLKDAAFPGSVTVPNPTRRVFGEYSVQESFEGSDRVLSVSGKLVAAAPADVDAEIAAIKTAIGSSLQLHRQSVTKTYAAPSSKSTTDPFRMTADFSLDLIDLTASPDVFDFQEVIEVRPQFQERIIKPMLGGVLPIIQFGAILPAEIIQAGSCKGRASYPAFPTRRFLLGTAAEPDNLIKESPLASPTGTGYIGYPIRWRYRDVYVQQLTGVPDPGLPPQ